MKKLNKKYTRIVVNNVLIQGDPEDLIAIGAPRDEYEPETRVIVDYIIKNKDIITTEKLAMHICRVFNSYFLPTHLPSDFIEIAQCILMNLE